MSDLCSQPKTPPPRPRLARRHPLEAHRRALPVPRPPAQVFPSANSATASLTQAALSVLKSGLLMQTQPLQPTDSPRPAPQIGVVPEGATFANWPGFVFDTETTGVDVSTDRVVELGAVCLESGQQTTVRRMRLNPQMPIPPGASEIHGIHDKDVADKPLFAQVAERFVCYLTGKAQSSPPPWLCGYNATGFDAPLLNAELARAGFPIRIDPSRVVDPMIFVRWHLRHLRSRSLSSACSYLKVPLENAHSALDDAKATASVLQQLVQRGLIPQQVTRALADQARFAKIMDEEWQTWSYWLYRDRQDGELRLGAGTHCGRYLREVSPDYLHTLLSKVEDLPTAVRSTFLAKTA